MVQAIQWAALGTLFTFLMPALGAAAVFFLPAEGARHGRQGMLGFAAGVMTAASVWSLLLPAIERSEHMGLLPWVPPAVGLGAGALFLAGVESVLDRLEGQRNSGDALLMTAITLHNIPEGMAVGLAFALAARGESFAGAAALALGIGVQNFPEGAAIALPLAQEGMSRRRAFLRGMESGAVEPLFGVAVVLFASAAEAMMPWLLSFAAGAMLYVVVEELVPQAHSRAGTCGFVGGFLIMMVLDVALG